MARKTHNDRLDIPPLELECMKMLWTRGAATVHQVRADLLPTRPLAYTTVMTLMDRLARKGIAEREKHGRAYLYRPVLAEQSVRDFALDRLARNFFRGSRDALRNYLEVDGSPVVSPASAASPPAAPIAEPAARVANPKRSPRALRARPTPAVDTIDPSLL